VQFLKIVFISQAVNARGVLDLEIGVRTKGQIARLNGRRGTQSFNGRGRNGRQRGKG
jgi:hypothetical protein